MRKLAKRARRHHYYEKSSEKDKEKMDKIRPPFTAVPDDSPNAKGLESDLSGQKDKTPLSPIPIHPWEDQTSKKGKKHLSGWWDPIALTGGPN